MTSAWPRPTAPSMPEGDGETSISDEAPSAAGDPTPVTGSTSDPANATAEAADNGGPSGGGDESHRLAVDAVDAVLDQVEQALTRLDDGTYGRCETCGEPIADAQLAERPVIRRCGTCDEGGMPTGAGITQPVREVVADPA